MYSFVLGLVVGLLLIYFVAVVVSIFGTKSGSGRVFADQKLQDTYVDYPKLITLTKEEYLQLLHDSDELHLLKAKDESENKNQN